MRVIAIANQKGGCGKTTTCINLSACLALLEKNVLMIDLDPQGHTTCGFGIQAEKLPLSLYDLLSPHAFSKPPVSQVMLPLSPFLTLLPSYVVLGAAEEELVNMPNKEKRLKEIIEEAELHHPRFDYVLIDCPPNLGILTFNALHAADDVIIPIEPSFFSLHGLAKISETIHYLNQVRSVPIQVHALITLFDSESEFPREIYEEVQKHFREKLFKAVIHDDVKLKEAAGCGKSIEQYDRYSQAFKDYYNLAVEYLERDWNRRLPQEALGWENAVKRRLGPKKVVGGILFQTVAKNAKCVEIAGDFNQWIPEPLLHRPAETLWQIVIPIFQGKYRYKFIVDGEWQLDPYQAQRLENAHGLYDSYLELV